MEFKIGDIVKFNTPYFSFTTEHAVVVGLQKNNCCIAFINDHDFCWQVNAVDFMTYNLDNYAAGKFCCWTGYSSIELVSASEIKTVKIEPFHCIECNYSDKFTTQSNLSENRFICFSCAGSYSWKYRDQLI